MTFWGQVTTFVLIVVSVPFVRAIVKRLIFYYKITKVCERKGFLIHPTHLLWLFGINFMKRCDFHIETPDEIISVKLFGALRRFRVLILNEEKRYFYRYFIVFFSPFGPIFYPIETRKKYLPNYNFKYKVRPEWLDKKTTEVLLVNPVSIEARFKKVRGEEYILYPKIYFKGMMFSNSTYLLSYLDGI